VKTTILLALSLVACTTENDALTGTQSLRVEILSPTTTGTVDQRLPDTQRTLMVNLTAVDAAGDTDTSFNDPIRVYAQFLGTLTPSLESMPLVTIPMANGVATAREIMLPASVLGPTTLWFDNGTGLGPDYVHGKVTGTTDTLWYRDPFISDLQTPRNETDIDALTLTPLTDKQVSVSDSRYGARGRLVVTSVFSQGYTASDVECADSNGTPPCTAMAYDHIMVFTFSAARDQHGRLLEVGRLLTRFNGGLSEFNGLTEIGFPRTYAPEADDEAPAINLGRVPAPVRFNQTWFEPLSDPAGRINFERNEAGAIEVLGAKVCPTDDDYYTYKQWKIDPSGVGTPAVCNGNKVISVITAGTDFTTDPRTLVGRVIPRMVGIVRPVSIGSFNVWIIFPRGTSDVTL
jgi:hypothetical protein